MALPKWYSLQSLFICSINYKNERLNVLYLYKDREKETPGNFWFILFVHFHKLLLFSQVH